METNGCISGSFGGKAVFFGGKSWEIRNLEDEFYLKIGRRLSCSLVCLFVCLFETLMEQKPNVFADVFSLNE